MVVGSHSTGLRPWLHNSPPLRGSKKGRVAGKRGEREHSTFCPPPRQAPRPFLWLFNPQWSSLLPGLPIRPAVDPPAMRGACEHSAMASPPFPPFYRPPFAPHSALGLPHLPPVTQSLCCSVIGHCCLTGHWVPGHWSFCLSQAVPLNRLTFWRFS